MLPDWVLILLAPLKNSLQGPINSATRCLRRISGYIQDTWA